MKPLPRGVTEWFNELSKVQPIEGSVLNRVSAMKESKCTFELRKMQRTGHCRGCDDTLPPGTWVIAGYSIRNRGQHIYFCAPCAKDIGDLATHENTQQ